MSCRSFRSLVVVTVCSLVWAVTGQCLNAATITLNANRDLGIFATTFVAGGQPLNDSNSGGSIAMQVGTAGGAGLAGEARTLVSFNQNLIPDYSSINSVTLRLYVLQPNTTITAASPFTVEVHSISNANADWVEGTGTNSGAPTDDIGSNWNRKNEVGSINWAGGTGTTATGGLRTPGLDYDVTTLASYSFTSDPANGTPIDFVFSGTSAQLTNLINSWDTTNAGLVLMHNNVTALPINTRVIFHTRENANPLFQPQLLVDFTPVPAPEPSSLALLGLGMLLIAKRRR